MTVHLSSLIHPDRKLFAYDVPHETREQIEGKLEKMAARSILWKKQYLLLLLFFKILVASQAAARKPERIQLTVLEPVWAMKLKYFVYPVCLVNHC